MSPLGAMSHWQPPPPRDEEGPRTLPSGRDIAGAGKGAGPPWARCLQQSREHQRAARACQVPLAGEASAEHPVEVEGAPTPRGADPKPPVPVVPSPAPVLPQPTLSALPQQDSRLPPRRPGPCPPPQQPTPWEEQGTRPHTASWDSGNAGQAATQVGCVGPETSQCRGAAKEVMPDTRNC